MQKKIGATYKMKDDCDDNTHMPSFLVVECEIRAKCNSFQDVFILSAFYFSFFFVVVFMEKMSENCLKECTKVSKS